jgi:hypothetical protein
MWAPAGSFFSVMDSDRLPGLGDMDDWASPIIQELHRMGINVRLSVHAHAHALARTHTQHTHTTHTHKSCTQS